MKNLATPMKTVDDKVREHMMKGNRHLTRMASWPPTLTCTEQPTMLAVLHWYSAKRNMHLEVAGDEAAIKDLYRLMAKVVPAAEPKVFSSTDYLTDDQIDRMP